MNIDCGRHIKIILKNNIIVEGIVEFWADKDCLLKSLDDDSIFLIPNPNSDIIMVKMFNKSKKPIQIETEKKSELEKKFEETYEKPSDDDLRLKNLAELKSELIEQEKKIIANKLKNHHIGEIKKVQYGNHYLNKKPSAK